MLARATFETLRAASAYAPAIRTVVNKMAMTNAVISRCTKARGESAFTASLTRRTADQRATGLRIDRHETRVDGRLYRGGRGRRRHEVNRRRSGRVGRGRDERRRNEFETVLERVVVATDDQQHVAAERVLGRRRRNEIERS